MNILAKFVWIIIFQLQSMYSHTNIYFMIFKVFKHGSFLCCFWQFAFPIKIGILQNIYSVFFSFPMHILWFQTLVYIHIRMNLKFLNKKISRFLVHFYIVIHYMKNNKTFWACIKISRAIRVWYNKSRKQHTTEWNYSQKIILCLR